MKVNSFLEQTELSMDDFVNNSVNNIVAASINRINGKIDNNKYQDEIQRIKDELKKKQDEQRKLEQVKSALAKKMDLKNANRTINNVVPDSLQKKI